MDSFETIIRTLLQREGYWVRSAFKVELTKAEKRSVGKPSTPRWELDLIGYRGATNEVLVVECKSYLDSPGVKFEGVKGTHAKSASRYKLFNDATLRRIVLRRLVRQLEKTGLCAPSPTVVLALAAGNIATDRDRKLISDHFNRKGWRFLDEAWVYRRLAEMSESDYEDDVAVIATKILVRNAKRVNEP